MLPIAAGAVRRSREAQFLVRVTVVQTENVPAPIPAPLSATSTRVVSPLEGFLGSQVPSAFRPSPGRWPVQCRRVASFMAVVKAMSSPRSASSA